MPIPSVFPTPPERQSTLQLPDTRTLAWSEWGPVDGIPVLFCTGAAMSGSLGFSMAFLRDLDLRLIAIDRPGLGRSDPHPAKTLSSWVADIRVLLRSLARCPVLAVGFSQGAPFALALAGGGLVAGLAIVSGQDELAHPDLLPRLHPEVRGMVETARADPVGFECQFAQMASAEGLWRLIIAMSGEQDRRLYESEGFGAAYRQCLEEGFAQGSAGYARDLVNALGPWPVVEEITVPVDLWYGALDTSTVHSPDFGETLAARLPHATRTVDPVAGGSILWTRAGDILGRLRSRVDS